MLAALALHLSFLLDAFVLSLFERQEPHTCGSRKSHPLGFGSRSLVGYTIDTHESEFSEATGKQPPADRVHTVPTIMSRGPIDLWTRTPRSIAPFSASAPSHHNLSSADFITNIAESNFRYTQPEITEATGELINMAVHRLDSPNCAGMVRVDSCPS